MDSDKLLPHLENLVPGFVTIGLCASGVSGSLLLSPNTTVIEILKQPALAFVVVTAFAYLIGALVFVMSRAVIDTLSLLTFRWLFLKLFRWTDFPGFNPISINQKYRNVLNSVLQEDKDHARRQEVVRRRERARILRTTFVPALMLGWRFESGWLAVTTSLIIVVLYAYAEVAIYQEAKLSGTFK